MTEFSIDGDGTIHLGDMLVSPEEMTQIMGALTINGEVTLEYRNHRIIARQTNAARAANPLRPGLRGINADRGVLDEEPSLHSNSTAMDSTWVFPSAQTYNLASDSEVSMTAAAVAEQIGMRFQEERPTQEHVSSCYLRGAAHAGPCEREQAPEWPIPLASTLPNMTVQRGGITYTTGGVGGVIAAARESVISRALSEEQIRGMVRDELDGMPLAETGTEDRGMRVTQTQLGVVTGQIQARMQQQIDHVNRRINELESREVERLT